MTTVAISGGYDPLHAGHLELMKYARMMGDRLVVILNTDRWLEEKKGAPLLPFDHRYAVLSELSCVDAVLRAHDTDGTVCDSLRILRPDYFVNAGDRTHENTPEIETCKSYGICPVWLKLDRYQDTHSSELLEKFNARR